MYSNEEGALRYQRTLVPIMFAPLARVLVKGADLARDARVLDIATGTGVVARTAAAVIPQGRVFAFDTNPNMVAVARSTPSSPGSAPIEYLLSSVEEAPIPAVGFDAIFCQQGLQFFEDPVAALTRIRHMLKPEGKLYLALWAEETSNPFTMAVQNALRACELEDLTAFLSRVHRLHAPSQVIELLQRGGFRLLAHEDVCVAPDEPMGPADAARLLQATPLAAKFAELGPERNAELAQAMQRELERWAANGVIQFAIPANLYHAQPA